MGSTASSSDWFGMLHKGGTPSHPTQQRPHPPVFKCALKFATFSNWSANTALGCSAARRRATFTK